MSFATKNPRQARALLDSGEGWTYIDVRTVEEFAMGHPPGAFNIPFAVRDPDTGQMRPNPAFQAVTLAHFRADRKLVLGCAAGGRSLRACQALAGEGFTNLVNMDGGYLGRRDADGRVVQPGWQPLGYPIEVEGPADHGYAHLEAGA